MQRSIKITFVGCILITLMAAAYFNTPMIAVRGIVLLSIWYLIQRYNEKKSLERDLK